MKKAIRVAALLSMLVFMPFASGCVPALVERVKTAVAPPAPDAAATPDATPTPDAAPTPDATPTPDAAPAPDAASRQELEGILDSLPPEKMEGLPFCDPFFAAMVSLPESEMEEYGLTRVKGVAASDMYEAKSGLLHAGGEVTVFYDYAEQRADSVYHGVYLYDSGMTPEEMADLFERTVARLTKTLGKHKWADNRPAPYDREAFISALEHPADPLGYTAYLFWDVGEVTVSCEANAFGTDGLAVLSGIRLTYVEYA